MNISQCKNRLEVCLYYVSKCDKIETTGGPILRAKSGVKIASRCAYIFVAFCDKIGVYQSSLNCLLKGSLGVFGVLLFWRFWVLK